MKITPVFTALLLFSLLRPAPLRACDACSCSASNLSQWTTFGSARSLIEANTQWLHWSVDGYALADSITDQHLHLFTLNGLYNVNARWSLLGGISINRTAWAYPSTTTVAKGVGNLNFGARYTRYVPIAGRNLYLGGSALVHLPNGSEAADPLNLSQSPLGFSANAFVRYQRGMHHHLLVWAGRYHSPRQGVHLGSSAQWNYQWAWTFVEKGNHKVQWLSGAQWYRQNQDMDNTQTGAYNQYSGGSFLAVPVGLNFANSGGALSVQAVLPVHQRLGNGTSTLGPSVRTSLKIYLGK